MKILRQFSSKAEFAKALNSFASGGLAIPELKLLHSIHADSRILLTNQSLQVTLDNITRLYYPQDYLGLHVLIEIELSKRGIK